MSREYDVVVIGSGHNALVAAAYLAVAGKRVLVLERNAYPGGGSATAELTEPGFHSERHGLMHVLILANPLITRDELGLVSRYGLEYIDTDKPYAAIFDDGTCLTLYRDRARSRESIARFSKADAEAYEEFATVAGEIVEAAAASFFVPPPSVQDYFGRELATPAGLRAYLTGSRSFSDVLDEWFEGDHLKIAITRLASEIVLTHPDDKSTGFLPYAGVGFLERYGVALPRGGSGSLTNALVRCILDHGGELRTHCEATEVVHEQGRAVAVRTSGGELIGARDAVLGSLHPHHLGRFVDGLDPELLRAARQVQLSPFTGFAVHAALEEPIRYRVPGVDMSVLNTLTEPSLAAMYDAYDDLRRGRLPRLPLLCAGCTSVEDPSRAPAGKAVLHVFCQVPYRLADGGPERWNEIKDAYADQVLARLAEFTTNLSPSIIRSRHVVTPFDHETSSPSFAGGDILGAAMYGYQSGSLRPTPRLSDYRVPGVERLYLAGPFMHPGGGITGGGRATAMTVFQDLALDPSVFGTS
ncbi:NAD(P)/FAD-dependent oxidoreductase [Streptomyces sp. DSM 44917]|uniref:Pyridine nucleotide-disulfide oxidoreductase domain-containing protein 2 n=1 Tax=Streptomyces boetiae TaxID=3075541 RepID=A0ABU2L5J5_9ACTN|nr:NAD(P)/FAD-dependent oxidoreductase [Streptomyces sp. DSM 44917]MDT0306503.1 NAD(P)/FAD-dependent oxidoreductase [Streptomyces sp. DSM 44917]